MAADVAPIADGSRVPGTEHALFARVSGRPDDEASASGERRSFLQRLAIALWRVLTWRHWTDAVAVLFFAGLALYFHRDAVLFGQIFYEKDTWAFYLPLAQQFDRALEQGFLPLWSRALFSGFPLFADSESGMLYPINLLLFGWFDPIEATVWKRVLAFGLAGSFMYGFGRAMRFRPFAAAIAGVVFTYGSFLVSQIHHTNVVQSAIWLPLLFSGLEMGFRSYGRRRYQWFVLGALALCMQTLAVHPQVVLMSLFAVGLFIGWRTLLGPMTVQFLRLPAGTASFRRRLLAANSHIWLFVINRGFSGAAALVIVVGVGMAAGAAQLLPLYELVRFSLRGGGVSYEFASDYSLASAGLTQLVSPHLFQLRPGAWWVNWASWETALYVGIPTLVLALIALVCARNRHMLFFLLLAIAAGLVALGPSAPLNLHGLLWQLPGFDSMRAPGRFSLLVVFAFAGLAGVGAQWLDAKLIGFWVEEDGVRKRRHWRSGWFGMNLALLLALPLVVTGGVLLAQAWVRGYHGQALNWLGVWTPLPDRFDFPGYLVASRRLTEAISLSNPDVAVQIALLQGTVFLIALWYLIPRFGHVWKGALLGLLAFDLLAFGAVYHPVLDATSLAKTTPAAQFLADNAGTDRVVVRREPGTLEHNRLLALGVRTLGGYSSLPLQRHLEYLTSVQEGADTFPDRLLEAAGVRYVASPAKFIALPSYRRVSYDPHRPLIQAGRAQSDSHQVLAGETLLGDHVRIVAALTEGTDIPQDTPVAELTAVMADGQRQSVTLRAGREVSEWAHSRGDIRPLVRHQPAEKAFTTWNTDVYGVSYDASVSFAELPLGQRGQVTSVEYRYIHERGKLRLYGLAIINSETGDSSQMRRKPRYDEVYRDASVVILENSRALPRAYFVNRAVERKSDKTILADMLDGSFNPREMVFLEDPQQQGFPRTALVAERAPGLAASRPMFRPANAVADVKPTETVIDFEAPDAGYLVITDSFYPGWKAYLDGQPVPLYRANYLFQAVPTNAGSHRLLLRYEPAMLTLGISISMLSLGALAALVAVLEASWMVHVGAVGLARLRRLPAVAALPGAVARLIARARKHLNSIDG